MSEVHRETADRIQRLEDGSAIRELWGLYCRLCDQKDAAALVTDIYAPDAVEEYALGSHKGRLSGRAEIETYFADSLATCEWTTHFLGQTWVEIDGDRAHGWHYVTAYHWFKQDAADPLRQADWVAVGILSDALHRGVDGWRVTHRTRNLTGGMVAVGHAPA